MNVKELPVVKEVASTLKDLYGNRLSKIILYGSFARGEQHAESDIDFLVMLHDEKVSQYKEINFYNEEMNRLSHKYKIEISVMAKDEHFIERTDNYLARFIRKDGILIS